MSLTHNSLSYELSLTHFWSNELEFHLNFNSISTHFFFLRNTDVKIHVDFFKYSTFCVQNDQKVYVIKAL